MDGVSFPVGFWFLEVIQAGPSQSSDDEGLLASPGGGRVIAEEEHTRTTKPWLQLVSFGGKLCSGASCIAELATATFCAGYFATCPFSIERVSKAVFAHDFKIDLQRAGPHLMGKWWCL